MIYTVTLNPSLDYIVRVENFREGIVNRTASEMILAGGKGINVSLVLHELGCETKALGFLAGFTGDEIARRIRETGCKEDFIRLEKGVSRINVKLKSGEETEINGSGPYISAEDWERLLMKIAESVKAGDILVLSGSAPKMLGTSVYRKIAERVSGKDIKTVVDASGALLTEILPCRPFLIKPNHHELSELFGVCIETREQAVIYAKKLLEMGAENVMVSMAEKGAVLVTADAVYEADAPKGRVINSVGAGDSMVAGFLAGYSLEKNFEKALELGIAAGSASAFGEGLAKKEQIQKILSEMYSKES
ncbi:MAG: 1-phosphofructokinase [Clostridia bacterium]|nr:1-phosphofructokinase [Clostridia bacterium]